MSLLYIGRIEKLEIGLSAATNTDITNVILMNWERNHDVRPRLYANLKYPRTYQQPHSWILGSFSLLSDNHVAIYETDVQAAAGNQYAMYEDADSNVIDFLQVTYQDEDGAARVTRFFYPIIYRYNKELLNYDDSTWIYHFMAGYAEDSDVITPPLIYNLVSASAAYGSGGDDSIFIHDGITAAILTSFSTPEGNTIGLAFDGTNLISADPSTGSIYVHSGVTSTILTSFSVFDVEGCVYISPNLHTSEATLFNVYVHSGITSTITTSFSAPAIGNFGLAYDGTNLISASIGNQSVYIHTGVTSAITTSFSTPGPGNNLFDLDYHLGNLISGGAFDNVYIHSGVTSTVTTSFSHVGGVVTGLTVIPA